MGGRVMDKSGEREFQAEETEDAEAPRQERIG